MYITFLILGLIDLVAGAILFFNASLIVKIIAIALLTKGVVSVVKATQH